MELPIHYMTALKASIEASKAIMEVYKTDFLAVHKEDGSPVTKADIESSNIIVKHLEPTGIPIIGEETEAAPYEERVKWKENWCVDPLDGTRMFLKKNDEFSVNIAHIVQSRSVFGIIASPTKEEILFGGEKFGSFISSFNSINTPSDWKAMNPRAQVKNPLTVT
ncbi:MAG: hypothetical protein HRT57_03415, partial [Crocinitomicaceae bacterium]|nr:hypothetical protein [Crocinitomicaceae bacterium]